METENSLLLHFRRLAGKAAIGWASFFQQMGNWATVNVRLPPLPLLGVRANSRLRGPVVQKVNNAIHPLDNWIP